MKVESEWIKIDLTAIDAGDETTLPKVPCCLAGFHKDVTWKNIFTQTAIMNTQEELLKNLGYIMGTTVTHWCALPPPPENK